MRVLVVDDEPGVVRATVRTLQRAGYDVAALNSCEAARAAVGTYDVGVFDIELGDGCGADLAVELRDAGRVREVVFFTGSSPCDAATAPTTIGPVVSKADGPAELLPVLQALAPHHHAQSSAGRTSLA